VKRLVPVLVTLCLAVLARPSQAADSPAKEAAEHAKPLPAAVDSVGMLERAVAKDSTKFDNLYRLGVLYLDRDRVLEATQVLTKANRLRPKDVKTLVNLGVAFDAAGKPAEAQKYYMDALAIAPTDTIAACRLAGSYYAQGKYTDSMDQLRTLIQKHPQAYCAYFTLGVAFADAGLYRDAIRMWRKVVQIAPGSPEAISANESIEVLEKFVQKQ
jgi:tetratricopeptide (TPR) repeat protein